MPAGTTESFFAAVEGGADAIYLGLKKFNARGRAKNFSYNQFAAMKRVAKQNNVKLFVTLNTLAKNNEIDQLIETVGYLEQLKPDAVIVQDLGVLHLINKYFPEVEIHASTQMAIHNSAGVRLANNVGAKRIILFREITEPELENISKLSKAELEIFVHGALC